MASRARFVLGLLLAVLFATPALGGVIRVDLPELLGDYTSDEFIAGGYDVPMAHPRPDLAYWEVTTATVHISGTVSPGAVRGDGILREDREIPVSGGFGIGFSSDGGLYFGFITPQAADMPFTMEQTFTGPFKDVTPLPGSGESLSWNARVWLNLGFDPFGTSSLEWLVPITPGGFRDAAYGLVITAPISGTITEAYIDIEGFTLPEPATLALLGAGITFAAARRRIASQRSMP